MIDGIKLLIKNPGFAGQLIQNPIFDFVLKVSDSTAEIKDGKEAKYKGLTIRVYNSGVVIISGSLHKFKNNGLYNYDNFYMSEVIEVIHKWQKLFGFDLNTVKIENLEFGVNLIPPIPTKEVLKNIVNHKREPFKHVSHPNSDYIVCVHQQFIIKTYDKSKQYNQTSQLLRVEDKYLKMAELNSIGINYLSDLLNHEIYMKLGQILIDTWNEILYIDQTVNIEKLTLKQREDYKNWINPTGPEQ